MSTIQSSSNEESIPLTTLTDENVEFDKTPVGGNVNISGVKGLDENPVGILTKADMANFATKADLAKELANFATKADLANFATKKDLANFATKKDLDVFMKKIEKTHPCGLKCIPTVENWVSFLTIGFAIIMFGVVALTIIYSLHFFTSDRLGSLESKIDDKIDALAKAIDKLKEGCQICRPPH
ncbi:unnamed protein product [Meloidogyne enterolobii]|uniref:Uncharacterized protein n=1 Tax=Meloidogyne enterolobii TaxID=390850 RepID=A0ACB0YHX2_MELEN